MSRRNDSIFPQDAAAKKAERIRIVKQFFEQAKAAGKDPKKGVLKFFLHLPYLVMMTSVGWVGLCLEILTILGFYSVLVAANVDKIDDIGEDDKYYAAKEGLSSLLVLGKYIREAAKDSIEFWRELWKGSEAHQFPLVYINDLIHMLEFEPEVRDLNSSEPAGEPSAPPPTQPPTEPPTGPSAEPTAEEAESTPQPSSSPPPSPAPSGRESPAASVPTTPSDTSVVTASPTRRSSGGSAANEPATTGGADSASEASSPGRSSSLESSLPEVTRSAPSTPMTDEEKEKEDKSKTV